MHQRAFVDTFGTLQCLSMRPFVQPVQVGNTQDPPSAPIAARVWWLGRLLLASLQVQAPPSENSRSRKRDLYN